jgi:iron complex outermembrane receptor protein
MRGICKRFGITAIALAVSSTFGTSAAPAAELIDSQLENIVVTGAAPTSAAYEAPTQATLDAGEPQSVISQRFIENNATPAANYTDIINIAPSVSDTTPNGRGLAESLSMSIRGFQDGQFNVTFDGIPWNDANDFTHHSTSYFTADTIGKINVDRGPGTAAQIGNATFGGTVALQSKDPLQEHNVSPSLTLGSFHSSDYSLEVDTGAMAQADGGRAMLALTSINSDGAMTNNGLERKNAFLKYVQPLSVNTSITAVAMYNTLHQNVSQFGTTLANLSLYGPNYSLSNNVSSDSYYGFNFDDIHTDFEYVQVKTAWDAWRLDNKTYTYAYYHKINETNDPSLMTGSLGSYVDLGQSPGTAGYIPTTASNYFDVAGQKGYNNYRSWGDTARIERDLGPGVARFGLWFDYQWNDRALWDVDWTQGAELLSNPLINNNGFDRLMHDTLTTISPFFEYEYRPIEALTITPGVRYSSLKRDLIAPVDQGTLTPLTYSHTWSATLPSVYANYHLSSSWSAYAQFAKGFLAPNLNLLYKTSQAAASSITPENTNNLQAGTTWKSDRLTLAADVYHINFNNFVSTANQGANLIPVHGGSAVFKGAEFEGTVVVGAGVSLYANASHNGAAYADGNPVLNAPNGTDVLGVIYDANPLYASLLSKHVGAQVQSGASGDENISGYTVNDLAIVYTARDPGAGAKDVKIKLGVSNLADNRSRYYLYGTDLTGTYDAWMSLPGRAYTLGIAADF